MSPGRHRCIKPCLHCCISGALAFPTRLFSEKTAISFETGRAFALAVVSFQGKSHGPKVWMQGCKLQVSLRRRIEAAKCTWTPGLNPGEGAEEFFPTERFFGFGAASTS